jgi:uncharacterized membrane protein
MEPTGESLGGTAAPTGAAQAPGPATSEPAGQRKPVSFAIDIAPILQSRCVSCHGPEKASRGLSLQTYADMMAGSADGPVVAAGDAAGSLLVDLVAKQKMPKRGTKLTPEQVLLITDWVDQGAQDN